MSNRDPGCNVSIGGDCRATIEVLVSVPTVLFRIIQNEEPTLDDFRTMEQLGAPLNNESHRKEWAEGVSVYDREDYAIQRARASGFGRYVVPMTIPDDSTIEYAQTFSNRRHYTIYACGQEALALVSGPPVPVSEHEDG